MILKLGLSSCPNDTFIFDAMLHQKVDTEGLSFEPIMEDVEQLNYRAFKHELPITKLSYHTIAQVIDAYAILDSGSALGFGVGPLLISKNILAENDLLEGPIAIPGLHTTAYFLLRLKYPNLQNVIPMLFSEIENAVMDGHVRAGLIIHENRFTYQSKGLYKLADLGEYWEQLTQSPIPLGGIVVNRSLPIEIQRKVERIIRRSIEYAFDNPADVMPYVRHHAQAMEESVMKQHINLYVNKYSISLGKTGKKAVQTLINQAKEKHIIQKNTINIFIN